MGRVFISQSVHEVVMAIIGALLLVVLVVHPVLCRHGGSFNHSRSSLSLFSLGRHLCSSRRAWFSRSTGLSLFGPGCWPVGIVVDDAIVVVENVERNLGLGLFAAPGSGGKTMGRKVGRLRLFANRN